MNESCIIQKAFPYYECHDRLATLKKLKMYNDSDTRRYLIKMGQRDNATVCTFIGEVDREGIADPTRLVEYVQNPTGEVNYPLLCRIPYGLDKVRIDIDLRKDQLNNIDTTRLIIIKTGLNNMTAEKVLNILDKRSSKNDAQISIIKYTDLPIKQNDDDIQSISINDTYDSKIKKDGQLCIYIYRYESTKQVVQQLLKFSFWVNGVSTLQASNIKEENDRKSVDENNTNTNTNNNQVAKEKDKLSIDTSLIRLKDFRRSFNVTLEDGPNFRTLLNEYEREISEINRPYFLFVEEVKSWESALKGLQKSRRILSDLISTIVNQRFYSFLGKSNLKKEISIAFNEIFDPFEKQINLLLENVCDRKLISKISTIVTNNSLNASDSSSNELQHIKRDFEHNSKDFYSWLNKYLSNEKERPESKLLIKRKEFELSKFKYFNALNAVYNNQYFNALLENFMRFVAMDKKSEDLKSEFVKTNLPIKYTLAMAAISSFNSEKFQLKQLIESVQSIEELSVLLKHNSLNHMNDKDPNITSEEQIITLDSVNLIFHDASNNSGKIESSPMEENNSELSGILYALGGQGKQGWHKEWVTLNNGQLKEYSDWRKGRSLINEPIEVALSSVKPLTYDKRQYCFEIYTSRGNRHIFQAMNENERQKWTSALYKAGQQFDKARITPTVQKEDKSKRRFLKLVTDLGNPSKASTSSPINEVPAKTIPAHMPESEKDFIKLVRLIPDSDNHMCAECGTQEGVEWISLNFLVVFCVNCSSCHRSLGSHLSRIRSLRLDNFEAENEYILKLINNRFANSYLESSLAPESKIGPKAPSTDRLNFIRSKYVQKKFISKFENPNDLLVKAIQKNNVHDVVKYLACGGDPNMKISITTTSGSETQTYFLFEYALKKFTEVSDVKSNSSKLFVIPEILILHGCNILQIRISDRDGLVSEDAMDYWKARYSKLTGK